MYYLNQDSKILSCIKINKIMLISMSLTEHFEEQKRMIPDQYHALIGDKSYKTEQSKKICFLTFEKLGARFENGDKRKLDK